jgi:hypothetical protein
MLHFPTRLTLLFLSRLGCSPVPHAPLHLPNNRSWPLAPSCTGNSSTLLLPPAWTHHLHPFFLFAPFHLVHISFASRLANKKCKQLGGLLRCTTVEPYDQRYSSDPRPFFFPTPPVNLRARRAPNSALPFLSFFWPADALAVINSRKH